MANPPKFLFAGGGTGGHLFSGIAVAEKLRQNDPEAKTLFVGTTYGLEKDIVPEAGFPIEFISVSPLKGSGWSLRAKSLLQLPKAYFQSKKILKKFSPDVVIGIGGYASGPMTLAAHRMGIPTAIIEQNSIPGFTNRRLAASVDRIFITFAKAKDFFPKDKIRFTGNPTREMKCAPAKSKDRPFTVFILGGSQGAHALNAALVEALPRLHENRDQLHFIHQTGAQDYEWVKEAYAKAQVSAEVFPFLQNLAAHYAAADLMVCRAGAGTITELQNLGKPSLLIPYPFATDDHQLFNAKEMVESGAAEMVLNADLSGTVLAKKIQHYLKQPELLGGMSQQARALAKPDAAEQVLKDCVELIANR